MSYSAIGGGGGGGLRGSGGSGAHGGGGGGQNNQGGTMSGGTSTLTPSGYTGGSGGQWTGGGGAGAGGNGSTAPSGEGGSGIGGPGILVSGFQDAFGSPAGYFGGGGRGGSYHTSTVNTVVNSAPGGGGDGLVGQTWNRPDGGDGVPNSGGGGGGGIGSGVYTGAGGSGGSGTVIAKYSGLPRGGGGQIITQNGYTYHIFRSSGSLDFAIPNQDANSAIISSSTVNEGQSIFYRIRTSDLSDGTVLYWENVGTSANIDMLNWKNTGTATVTANYTSLVLNVSEDNLTEGSETVILQFRAGSSAIQCL
jgi:hypothetical protein